MKKYEKYKNDIINAAGCAMDRLSLVDDYHFKSCDDTACKDCLLRTNGGSCCPAARVRELWDKICAIPANLNKLNIGINTKNEIKSCNYINCKDCILKDCDLAKYLNEEALLEPISKFCHNVMTTDRDFILNHKDGIYQDKLDITPEEVALLREPSGYKNNILIPIVKTFDAIGISRVAVHAEIVEALPQSNLQLRITVERLEGQRE